MKKLISMMLMLCAIITFSACSSDDDGPSNPVSNQVVPSSAKIGSEVTVQEMVSLLVRLFISCLSKAQR